MVLPVSFTHFSSPNPLSKTFKSDNGNITKRAAAQMSSGWSTTIECDFSEFESKLAQQTTHEACAYGIANGGGKHSIATLRNAKPPKTIARTKHHFRYGNHPGILMIDHDPSEYVTRLDPESLLAILKPYLGDHAYLVRDSVSSGVHFIDKPYVASKGYHVYIPVSNSFDIPRSGKALTQRLWLAGYGVIALARNGAMLIRTLIDGAVFSSERLDFTGHPVILSDDLEYTLPKTTYQAGGYLDTSIVLDLTSEEDAQYKALVANAKSLMKDQSNAKKELYCEGKVKELVDQGLPEPEARERVANFAKSDFADLYPEFILDFAEFGYVTVGEVLLNPKKYDRHALADPIEGRDYGLSTAMFYANLDDGKEGKRVIHSLAHGESKSYFLHSTVEKPVAAGVGLDDDDVDESALLAHIEKDNDNDVSAADRYFSEHPNKPIFDFNKCTYHGRVVSKDEDGNITVKTSVLLDCSIRIMYSIDNDSGGEVGSLEHILELDSYREGTNRMRIDASCLASVDKFKVAMQQRRQIFYSNSHGLNLLCSYLFDSKPLKIRSLSVIGYDTATKGFYFPKFCYNENGERVAINGDNFYQDSKVHPFQGFTDPVIHKLRELTKPQIIEFVRLLHRAYGAKGLLALGFWIASTISHIVFDYYGFFPFLSLYGDPHSGKSQLTKLLNRCFFVDSEGHTMTASNTSKGELRKISQRSSMVCCLLEGRKDKSRFDYDSILPLYNRNALYTRATTSQDNRTHDLALQASIAFVWNHECFTIKPAKERVISLQFRDTDLTKETAVAWHSLNRFSPEALASIGNLVLTNRSFFETSAIDVCTEYTGLLCDRGVDIPRIAENHAIACMGISLLLEHLGVHDLFTELLDYAVTRSSLKIDNAKTDSPLADYFFESINAVGPAAGVCESNNELVVHLSTVLPYLQTQHNGFNDKKALIQELKQHDRFIALKNTRVLGGQKECYHFKLLPIKVVDNE